MATVYLLDLLGGGEYNMWPVQGFIYIFIFSHVMLS